MGAAAWVMASATAQTDASVQGWVLDEDGEVAGARVRVRATDNLTHTDAVGAFRLVGLEENQGVEIAAWADGYYVASTFVTPTVSGITLTLRRYHTVDHPEYTWVSPITGTSDTACGNCHPMILPQWTHNAHGGAIVNPRFYSLYNGTDLSGTVEIAPGYALDFPGTAGNCASCHAPGAGVDGYLTTDMNAVRGVITAGIHCDYCHKVGGVYIDPTDGSVYPNAPGAVSQRVLRPPPGDQIFFGPYDDIHDPDTYLPAISESRFCAPCHQFSFWGTPIYASYEEWLDSPYADQGVTCQACHMPPNGDRYFALPEVGGLEHPAEVIPSHLQRGTGDVDLLRETLSSRVAARQNLGRLAVTVTLTNTGAGHHVPTDHPGRHMILTVHAQNGGQALPLADGPRVPDWGGGQAGVPGKAYARVLQDLASGEAPVVSYWRPTIIASDNRIPALRDDVSTYEFTLPEEGGTFTVTVEVWFRRVYADLMEEKSWEVGDILMLEGQATVIAGPHWEQMLPLLVR
jgi:hypothetical protein